MSRTIAGSLYVAVSVALAALAAWPIYRSAEFLLLVAASTALGAAIAGLVAWRRGGGWMAAGLLTAVILLAGPPLAVPSRGDAVTVDGIVHGLGELSAGLVVGWKDLLTVSLPVGTYRNLLVPALVVFLVGTTSALLLTWRRGGASAWAVAVGVAMTGFGLLFGRTAVSAPLPIGPAGSGLALSAPVETAVGLGTLAAGVLWLSWRTRQSRREALRAAADASGVRLRRRRGMDVRRAGIGVGMVVVAALAALAVVPAAASAPRTVLREATGPRVEISRAVSPLAAYRASFTDARHDRVLFRLDGDHVPERIRLAVLDDYDGAVYRTASGSAASGFVRLAAPRPPGPGARVDVVVSIEALDGIWMPSAGTLAAVAFEGARAAALADGFYVDDTLSAAVQTTPWTAGDAYRLEASEAQAPALGEAEAPGVPDRSPEAPASLRAWMGAHTTGSGGAALAQLVTLLRERGYLSHALTDAQSAWMADTGVPVFAPSPAGHSLARIDRMFAALLEREQDPRAAARGDVVAAVGDDEQFAVATALMARELGFPARIVVGMRTRAADADLSRCSDGVCRAGDLSAWVEVHASTGAWIPVDVTPQHLEPPSRDVTAQPDPTIGTGVDPRGVDEVDPPRPAQEDTADTPDRPAPADLSWLWAALRGGALSLGVLLALVGPFLGVALVKALRRRGRRERGEPRDRVAAGWEEYLDAAADAGRDRAPRATRLEIAGRLGAPGAAELARTADEAVFSPATVTHDDALAFWRIVDAERGALTPTLWRRLRAAVSLRSFVPGRRRRPPSRTERGSRDR